MCYSLDCFRTRYDVDPFILTRPGELLKLTMTNKCELNLFSYKYFLIILKKQVDRLAINFRRAVR